MTRKPPTPALLPTSGSAARAVRRAAPRDEEGVESSERVARDDGHGYDDDDDDEAAQHRERADTDGNIRPTTTWTRE